MTNLDAVEPQKTLQANASAFFGKFHQKHGAFMKCASGCAACCHTQISVFESEAAVIAAGVQGLPDAELVKLRSALEAASSEAGRAKGTTPDGKKAVACLFLDKNMCSIYEFRPTICRTQGMAIQYKLSEAKDQIELAVDVCPLNFAATPGSHEVTLPPRSEACDLDRLTALQSIAENYYQKNKTTRSLEPLLDSNKRVALARLAAFVLRMLKSGEKA